MNIRRTIISFVLFTFAAVSTTFAFQTSGSDMLDFNTWDHNAVMNGGQSFQDVHGDVDVLVTASGTFLSGTNFTATTSTNGISHGSINADVGVPGGTQVFNFTFSRPVPVVVDFDLLDAQEILTITGGVSTPVYNHGGGLTPVDPTPGSPMVSELRLQGLAFGNSPSGASVGSVDLGMVSNFSMKYDISGATRTKYNSFTLGIAVPEPNSQGLLAFGFIGLLGVVRKKRSA